MPSSFADISIRFNANLKNFSTQMQNVEKTLQKNGRALKKAGTDFSKAISLPLAGVMAAIGKVSVDTAKFASTITESSKAAGLGAESYQEMDFALRQYGISTRDVNQSLGRLNQRIGLAAEGNAKYAGAFDRLGISVRDSSGVLKSSDIVFKEAAQSLSEIEDPAQRSAVASDLFGVNLSRRLLPALSEGSEGIQNFMDQARELGVIMSDEDIAAADAFTTALDNLKLQFSSVFREIGMKFIPLLKDDIIPAIQRNVIPLLQSFAERIGKLVTWFQNLSPVMQKTIGIITGLAVAVGPLIAGIGAFMSFIPVLISGITGVGAVLGALISPIGLIAAGLVGIVFAVTKNWDKIKPYIIDTINWFIDLYNESAVVRSGIELLVFIFKTSWKVIVDILSGAWDMIKSQLKQMVKGFAGLGKVIKGVFTASWKDMKEGAADVFKAVADSYIDAVGIFADTASQIGSDVSNQFQESINRIKEPGQLEHIKDIGFSMGKKAGEGFNLGLKDIVNADVISQAMSGRGKVESVEGVDAEQSLDLFDVDGMKGGMLEFSDITNRVSDDFTDKMLRMHDIAEMSAPLIGDAFAGMGDRFVDSLGLASDGMQGFLKEILSFATDTIAALLSQSIAQAITGAVTAGTASGPFGFFTTPAFIAQAIGTVTAAFAAIPKFADGGIISGPTLGLMGEYPGASRNPEVIAPLDKLRSMIGTAAPQNINVEVTGRLRGQDILLQSERARKYRDRRN